jgi:hypothetical protein
LWELPIDVHQSVTCNMQSKVFCDAFSMMIKI